MKKSEQFALENIKRISEVLRNERNEALALAQVKREEADKYQSLLAALEPVLLEIRVVLRESASRLDPTTGHVDLSARIRSCLAQIDAWESKKS